MKPEPRDHAMAQDSSAQRWKEACTNEVISYIKDSKEKEKKILATIPQCCSSALKVLSKASGYLSHSPETEN